MDPSGIPGRILNMIPQGTFKDPIHIGTSRDSLRIVYRKFQLGSKAKESKKRKIGDKRIELLIESRTLTF